MASRIGLAGMTHTITRTEWTAKLAATASTTARRPCDGTSVAWRDRSTSTIALVEHGEPVQDRGQGRQDGSRMGVVPDERVDGEVPRLGLHHHADEADPHLL